MVDYITLTINEQVLTNFFWICFGILLLWGLYFFINMIVDELERIEKRKKESIVKPYKEKYEKLQKEFDEIYKKGSLTKLKKKKKKN